MVVIASRSDHEMKSTRMMGAFLRCLVGFLHRRVKLKDDLKYEVKEKEAGDQFTDEKAVQTAGDRYRLEVGITACKAGSRYQVKKLLNVGDIESM
ncbi:hypothetical protein ACLB2K_055497 [Fragaria x ananassa]